MKDNLFEELNQKVSELEVSIRHLRKSGTAYAEAERDYKVTLMQELLKLRADGMAVTLIDKMIYGVAPVADKRLRRDIAKTVYDTNLEHINATKVIIRVLENQIDREWGAK